MNRRHLTLVLLLAVSTLSILDRSIVNILGQDIKTELSISDAQLGLLTGTAFGVLYATLGLPLGRLADRMNRFHLIAAAVAIWSAFTAVCGLATNYVQLFLSRAGVAVGEAGSSPASVALVTEIFPEGRRSTALAVILLGGPIGGFLGLFVGGLVGGHWGWRAAFLAAGIPGILVAAIILIFMRDPQPPSTRPASSEPLDLPKTLGMLFRRPRFPWLVLAHTSTTFFVYASGAWLPPIFIRLHGMTTAQIGGYASLAVGLGGALGTLGGGLVCDRLRKSVRHAEVKFLATALSVAIVSLLVIVLSPSRELALATMFIFNACAYAYLGPSAALVQLEATPESRSLAQAICLSVSVILNLGAGLPLVGALSDALRPHYGAIALAYALGTGCTIMGAVGLICWWRVYRLPSMSSKPLGGSAAEPISSS